jgi:hypothetical protein
MPSNQDSAVERKVMSKEQPSTAKTMRSASEKATAASAVRNDVRQMEAASRQQKRL